MDKQYQKEAGEKDWQGVWGNIPAKRELSNELRREGDFVQAHMVMVSPYYSAIKRFWWCPPVALWLMIMAAYHANGVFSLEGLWERTEAELDVLATVFRKTPWILGGGLAKAEKCLQVALDEVDGNELEVLPHNEALLRISYGDVSWRRGCKGRAWDSYHAAGLLCFKIESEDSSDREKQLVRVLSAVGFFYLDHGDVDRQHSGIIMVRDAYRLACEVSLDQAKKIRRQCWWRGIHIKDG